MLIKRKKISHIKQASAIVPQEVTLAAKAVRLELHKIQQEAKQTKEEAHHILESAQSKLKEAEQKVKEIIQKANQDSAQLKEKTYNEAFNTAKEEGELLKEQTRAIMHELFQVKQKALYQAHKEIINIALDLAGKILRYQAVIDPNVLKTQVVEAIKKASTEADRVQVFVNPLDLKLLEENISDMQRLFPSGIDIISLTRDSIDRGSCIVETKSGQLDASFSTQLQNLTNLIANLEVKEPVIEIDTTIEIPLQIKSASTLKEIQPQIEKELSIEEELKTDEPKDSMLLENGELSIEGELKTDEPEGSMLTEEEELLKEELLGEESLIELPQEGELFPFGNTTRNKVKDQNIEEPINLNRIQEEILEPGSILQDDNIMELPTEITEKEVKVVKENKTEIAKTDNIQSRKKLLDDFPERTEEETEELDELPFLDLEEGNEKEQEEKVIVEPKSILRLKKDSNAKSNQISEIAQEIEKNPEWKDLIQEEDEE